MGAHTRPYFFMGVCAPTMYGTQGSFFEGKGVSAPMTGYTMTLLFIYLFIHGRNYTYFDDWLINWLL